MLFKTAVIGLGVANLVVLTTVVVVGRAYAKRIHADLQGQVTDLRMKSNKVLTKAKAVFEALED